MAARSLSESELPCPSCGYSLRGIIAGERVTCPECGVEHLAAKIYVPDPPAEISTGKWLGAMMLPGVVVGVAIGICVLTVAPRPLPYSYAAIVLSIAWQGWLCWIAFPRWHLAVRLLLTLIGAAEFSLVNAVVAALVGGGIGALRLL